MNNLSIESILEGVNVESQKLEYKLGWDPTDIIHTIAAFATDYHNLGGGYLIIGVDEIDGRPVRPVAGLAEEKIDRYQKEFLNLIHKISPNYTPSISIEQIDGKSIVLIRCFQGDNRPYDCPVSLSKGKVQRAYYIRKGSNTVIVNNSHDKARLESLRISLPYDEQACTYANIDQIDLKLIINYLEDTKSPLLEDIDILNDKYKLLECLNLTCHPKELKSIKNTAILLFNSQPHLIFPAAKLEIVEFSDSSGRTLKEKTLTGPIHKLIVESLRYFKDSIHMSILDKSTEFARGKRIDNYPYIVMRELITNAMYHQGYNQRRNPVISVFSDRIEIMSYPAPLPPLVNISLNEDRITGGDYRNAMLGEFLKEYGLTEKRATGIPTAKRHLRKNNSPELELEMDDSHRTFFKATVFIHQQFLDSDQPVEIIEEILSESEQRIIELCMDTPLSLNFKGNESIVNFKLLVSKLLERKLIIQNGDKIKATKIGIDRYYSSY